MVRANRTRRALRFLVWTTGLLLALSGAASAQPILSISDARVNEGDSGTVNAVFTVSIDPVAATTVQVDYATRNGSASAADGDYEAQSGRLTFTPGTLRRTISVVVNGDAEVEPDETFEVVLSNPTGGAVIGDGVGQAIIGGDDELDRIRLVSAQPIVEGFRSAFVIVERVGTGQGIAAVNVSVRPGTATDGTDFMALEAPLVWTDGETGEMSVPVPIFADRLEEGDETIIIRLSEPQNAVLGTPSRLDLVIIDDDIPLTAEAIGGNEVTARINSDLALSVRVSRDLGIGIEGATVAWAVVEGNAEILDGTTTDTDSNGTARNRLRFGPLPTRVLATATVMGTDITVTYEIDVTGDLSLKLDADQRPDEITVAQVLDFACARAEGELRAGCDYLFSLSTADQRTVVEDVNPDDVAAQGNIAFEAHQTQLRNVLQHLAARRHGADGGTDQLALILGEERLDLDLLRQAATTPADAELVDQQLARALRGEPARGGAASGDPGDESAWSLFVSGAASFGERQATRREAGFDFDSLGLTFGVDYGFDHFVVGAAAGYMDTTSDIDADGGELDADGYTFSGYGSFSLADFYLDAVASWGRYSFDSSRNIDLPGTFQGQSRTVARGAPDSEQLAAALAFGYDVAWSAVGIDFFARWTYVDLTIDGYRETGGGPFRLILDEQDLESLQADVGAELTYTSRFTWGTLQPSVSAAYQHEFNDDTRLVRGRFAADMTETGFAVATEDPDRDFLRLGAGLALDLDAGPGFFVHYETDLSRDDLEVDILSGGLRWQF